LAAESARLSVAVVVVYHGYGGKVRVLCEFLKNIQMLAEEAGRNTPELSRRVVLNGYFDESGKLGDSEIVSFGGCFGVIESTLNLNAAWGKLLGQEQLSHVSMKEAMHFQGPFLKWKNLEGGQQKRDDLLRALAQSILDCGMLVVSCPFPSADFKALSQLQRRRFWNDPQYASFEACITGALHLTANTFLHITCDLSEEFSPKLVTLYAKLRNRDPFVKARCFALTFADDELHGGLQAADMIAYCSRAEHMTADAAPIVKELIEMFHTSDRAEAKLRYGHGADLGDGELSDL
jgi:hypothetical protein